MSTRLNVVVDIILIGILYFAYVCDARRIAGLTMCPCEACQEIIFKSYLLVATPPPVFTLSSVVRQVQNFAPSICSPLEPPLLSLAMEL